MRNIGEEILWDIVRVIKWIAMRVLRLFGSDAHFSAMIADYSNIMPLVEKAEFPEELVLNYQPEK